jgi:hypothetical protein
MGASSLHMQTNINMNMITLCPAFCHELSSSSCSKCYISFAPYILWRVAVCMQEQQCHSPAVVGTGGSAIKRAGNGKCTTIRWVFKVCRYASCVHIRSYDLYYLITNYNEVLTHYACRSHHSTSNEHTQLQPSSQPRHIPMSLQTLQEWVQMWRFSPLCLAAWIQTLKQISNSLAWHNLWNFPSPWAL